MALVKGMTACAHGASPAIDFQVACYGSLFLGSGRADAVKGPLDVAHAPVGADEAEFLAEVADEQAAADDATIAEWEHHWKGAPPVPSPLRPLVWVLARRVDVEWAIRAVPVVRQVWRYLSDDALAERVRAVVTETMGGSCRAVVAHSLGSMVAYETLALGETAWPGT
ncbi:MAG: hypothetical protein GEU94_14655, partial [Micromonosporaceae bacterium]|nr:hypothetical protein [Micromonosporaceae bacterium]